MSVIQSPPPAVNRAALAALDARAATAAARGTIHAPRTGGSTWTRLGATLQPGEEPQIAGVRQEPRACPDCGAVLEQVLVPVAAWLSQWEWPAHSCSERESRLLIERARAADEREVWLRNPPAARVVEIRQRCQLERWTPAGLDQLQVDIRWAGVSRVLRQHREIWLAGERPEKGVWLWGETNLRKTCATSGLLFDVAHRTGRSALVWNFEALMEQLRRAAQGRPHRYDPERIEAAELLLLDDIGTQAVTERAWVTLYGIVNAALAGWGGLPPQTVYVTSNESPDRVTELLCTREHPDGGARIVRRLIQLCDVLEVGA